MNDEKDRMAMSADDLYAIQQCAAAWGYSLKDNLQKYKVHELGAAFGGGSVCVVGIALMVVMSSSIDAIKMGGGNQQDAETFKRYFLGTVLNAAEGVDVSERFKGDE